MKVFLIILFGYVFSCSANSCISSLSSFFQNTSESKSLSTNIINNKNPVIDSKIKTALNRTRRNKKIRISKSEMRSLKTRKDKLRYLSIAGLAISENVNGNIDIIKIKMTSKLALRQELFNLASTKTDFSLNERIRLSLDLPKDAKKNVLLHIKGFSNKDRSFKQLINQLSSEDSLPVYNSKIWDLASIDLTSPMQSVVGIILKGAIDRSKNIKNVSDKISFIEKEINDQLIKRINLIKDPNLRKLMLRVLAVNQFCQGESIFEIYKKMVVNVNTLSNKPSSEIKKM